MNIKIIISSICLIFALCRIINAQVLVGGVNHTLIICEDSTVMAWGGGQGQLGNGSFSPSNIPLAVNTLTSITDVSGGEAHSMALKSDGTVWTFGSNVNGELGNGNNINSNVPVQVISLTGIIAIAGGGFHSIALRNDSTVWTWGDNYYGQLGNGNNTDSNVPIQVPGLSGIVAIVGGFRHSFALKVDGTLWTWGHNQYGQLGNGNNVDSNVPVQVNAIPGTVRSISGGNYFCLALMTDSTIWSWGNNYGGDLGIGNNIDSNIPVHINSLSGIIQVDGGTSHGIALKNDGTVWTWGLNVVGELGNGNTISTNLPGQVMSLSNVVYVNSPYFHSLAIKNDGTVWSWGENSVGELGIGNNTDSHVPVQVTASCYPKLTLGLNSAIELTYSVFPNPSEGLVFLKVDDMDVADVKIYNGQGQLVLSRETILLTELNKIDLTEQPSGIYYLVINDGSRNYSKKITLY